MKCASLFWISIVVVLYASSIHPLVAVTDQSNEAFIACLSLRKRSPHLWWNCEEWLKNGEGVPTQEESLETKAEKVFENEEILFNPESKNHWKQDSSWRITQPNDIKEISWNDINDKRKRVRKEDKKELINLVRRLKDD